MAFPGGICHFQHFEMYERTYCKISYPNSNSVALTLLFMGIRDLLLAYRPENNRPRYSFDFRSGNFCGLFEIPLKKEQILTSAGISRAKTTSDPAEIRP